MNKSTIAQQHEQETKLNSQNIQHHMIHTSDKRQTTDPSNLLLHNRDTVFDFKPEAVEKHC